jgi:hypothetical protein
MRAWAVASWVETKPAPQSGCTIEELANGLGRGDTTTRSRLSILLQSEEIRRERNCRFWRFY